MEGLSIGGHLFLGPLRLAERIVNLATRATLALLPVAGHQGEPESPTAT